MNQILSNYTYSAFWFNVSNYIYRNYLIQDNIIYLIFIFSLIRDNYRSKIIKLNDLGVGYFYWIV